jgi:succinate dehydrogenase / fumarate reductase membrane anchor subunit
MSLVTPLSRVLGLGSAKEGVEHWWRQRLTAVALLLLGPWLAISLAGLGDFTHPTVIAWMGGPMTAILLLLTVLTLVYHSLLGVQVVVEDYVHGAGAKMVTLVLNTFLHIGMAAAGVFAVFKVALGA